MLSNPVHKETPVNPNTKCYYSDSICQGRVLTCRNCKEMYCQTHWHETSKGKNRECAACERERLNKKKTK